MGCAKAESCRAGQADFKTAVCARIYGLFDCANGVYVSVKSYSGFSAINTATPITNSQFDTTNVTYIPGGPGCIVVVSVYYRCPTS